MPNLESLQALMNLQSPSNFAASLPAYTPNISRNVARTAALSKMFGIPDTGDISQTDLEAADEAITAGKLKDLMAEAQAKAYPEEVRGRYNVAAQQARAQAAVEMAKQRAADSAALQQERLAATSEQGRLTREAATERARGSQAAAQARQEATQRAITARQQVSDKQRQAAAIRAGKQHAPGGSALGSLASWLGIPGFKSQSELDAEYLKTLEGGAGGGSDVAAAAQDYAPYAHLNDADLMNVIQSTQPDATPDEHQALLQAIRGMH